MKKTFLLFILSLLAIITLNSCGNDDNGGDDNNGAGGTPKKLVKSIITEDVIDGDRYHKTLYTFQYDEQSRLINISAAGDRIGTATYNYEGNEITIEDDIYYGSRVFGTLSFNDDAYLTKYEEEDDYNVTFTYKNGYLTQRSSNTDEYTWQNGNLVAIEQIYDDGDYREEYKEEWAYDKAPNKMNIMNMYDQRFDLSGRMVCWLKLKRISSKNLPSSTTRYYDGIPKGITTYTYTFDDEGYPTKIVQSMDPDNTSTYTITYNE